MATKSFGLIMYIWKGESATAPASPAQNWVYRNTTDKAIYLYDSGVWKLMVKDGINGENGKTPEFQMSGNKLQWKYSTDTAWIDLFTFPDFTEYAKKTDLPDLSSYALKTDVPDSYTKTETDTKLDEKQDELVSGENIKTVGGQSLLGGGDIPLPSGSGGGGYSPPAGGIPKTDLASDVKESLEKADSALQSFTETDPTVPAWAKEANKPAYTAAEVGAATAQDIAEVMAAVETEETERQSADTALGTRINDEATARDTAITTAISTEVTNRDSAIATAKTAIETAYAAADTALGTRIDAEIENRQAADDLLLPKAGGTMTGDLVLNGDPLTDKSATPKEYVLEKIAEATGSALDFAGFVGTTEPTLDLKAGLIWLNVALAPDEAPSTAFPWTANISTHDGTSWVAGGSFTPTMNQQIRDTVNNETWFWAGNMWERLDFGGSVFDGDDFDTSGGAIKIKLGAINTGKMADGAVTNDKLAGSIDQTKIVGLEADLDDRAVKPSGTTAGNVAIVNADGTYSDGGKQLSSLLEKAAATADDIALLNADGTLKDSGRKVTDYTRRGFVGYSGTATTLEGIIREVTDFDCFNLPAAVTSTLTDLPVELAGYNDWLFVWVVGPRNNTMQVFMRTPSMVLMRSLYQTGWQAARAVRLDNVDSFQYTNIADGAYTNIVALAIDKKTGLYSIAATDLANYTDLPQPINPAYALHLDLTRTASGANILVTATQLGRMWSAIVQAEQGNYLQSWLRLDNASQYEQAPSGVYTTLSSMVKGLGVGLWQIAAGDVGALTDLPLNASAVSVMRLEVAFSTSASNRFLVNIVQGGNLWMGSVVGSSGLWDLVPVPVLTGASPAFQGQTPLSMTNLVAGDDLNNILKPGFYGTIDGNVSSYLNLPDGLVSDRGFVLEVLSVNAAFNWSATPYRCIQRLTPRTISSNSFTTSMFYQRSYGKESEGQTVVWGPWVPFGSLSETAKYVRLPRPSAPTTLAEQLSSVGLGRWAIFNEDASLFTDLPPLMATASIIQIEATAVWDNVTKAFNSISVTLKRNGNGELWWNNFNIATGTWAQGWVNIGQRIYSTQEQRDGVWVDGSQMYMKTFVFPNFTVSAAQVNTWIVLQAWTLGTANIRKAECVAGQLSIGNCVGNVNSNLCIAVPMNITIARDLSVTLWYTK